MEITGKQAVLEMTMKKIFRMKANCHFYAASTLIDSYITLSSIHKNVRIKTHLYNARIKVRSCQRPEVFAHLCHGPRGAVATVGPQRIPDVNHSKDACHKRDLFAFQAKRVTTAVPLFVMGVGDVECRTQVTDWREHFVGKNSMFFHHDPFFD